MEGRCCRFAAIKPEQISAAKDALKATGAQDISSAYEHSSPDHDDGEQVDREVFREEVR